MLDYKIKRFLLNPHRIRYFHEAEKISEYLKIGTNPGDFHDDFSTMMYELRTQKEPDAYFQSVETKKIFVSCLEQTTAYKEWVQERDRQLAEIARREAYERLSIFAKLAYNSYGLYLKLIKYPKTCMAYWYAGITTWADYRIRIKNYQESVQTRFDEDYKRFSVLEQEVIKIRARVFRKRKSSSKPSNKKKFKKINIVRTKGSEKATN